VRPAVARTWAIPWPVSPAPATNARSIDILEGEDAVSVAAATRGQTLPRQVRRAVARR